MATITESGVSYTISATDMTSAAVDSAISGTKKLGSSIDSIMDKMKAQAEAFQKHWMGISAAVYAAMAAIQKAWDMAKIGAGYDEQWGMLDNLAKKYSMTAASIIASMEKYSDYQVSKIDLLKTSLAGLAKGLDPTQMQNLAVAANVLGDAAGVDLKTALDDLTTALETGRTRGLKTYLGTTLDLRATFGDLESKLTEVEKAQAMYLITMQASRDMQAQLTSAIDGGADSIARVEKKFDDAVSAVSRFMKALVVSAIEAPKKFAEMSASVDLLTGKAIEAKQAISSPVDPDELEHGRSMFRQVVEEQLALQKKKVAARVEEEAAAKKTAAAIEAAEKSIREAIIKANAEVEGIGYSQYDRDIARIQGEVDKYREAGASKVIIRKFVDAEMAVADAREAQRVREAQDEGWKKFYELKTRESAETVKGAEEYRKLVSASYEYGATEYENAVNSIVAKEREKLDSLDELYTQLGEQGMMTWEQYEALKLQITSNTQAAILLKTKELSLERLKIERDLYSDIREQNQNAYDAGIALVESQAKKYRETLITKKTTAEEAAKYEVAIAGWVREQTYQLEQKKLKDSKDWKDGIKAFYNELVHDAKSWAERTYDLSKSLYKDMASSFSDLFYDTITLNLQSAEEYFSSFGKAIARSFSNTLGEMIADAAVNQVIMYFKATWTPGGDFLTNIWNVLTNTPAPDSFSENDNLGDWASTFNTEHLASGGRFGINQPFWSGEKGMELIFPDRNGGYVMNHEQSMAFAARAGIPIPGFAEGGAYTLYDPNNASAYNPRPYTDYTDWEYYRDRIGTKYWDLMSEEDRSRYVGVFKSPWAAGVYESETGYGLFGTDPVLAAFMEGGFIQKRAGQYMDTYYHGALVDHIYSPDSGPGFMGELTMALSQLAMTVLTAGATSLASSSLVATLAGAGMGGMTGFVTSGGNWLAALAGAIGGGIGGYNLYGTDVLGSLTDLSKLFSLDTLKSAAERYALKTGMNVAIGSLMPGVGGTAGVSYTGSEDGGLFSRLASWMDGGRAQFAFALETGLDRVPYTGMLASLDEDEAVLNSDAADAWRYEQTYGTSSSDLLDEIKGLRDETKSLRKDLYNALIQIVFNTGKQADLSNRWEKGGLPQQRTPLT